MWNKVASVITLTLTLSLIIATLVFISYGMVIWWLITAFFSMWIGLAGLSNNHHIIIKTYAIKVYNKWKEAFSE